MFDSFIKHLPKAELHLHLEGTLEPSLLFKIAQRNSFSLPYKNVTSLKEAYKFNNLQDFLNIYYQGAGVLLHEKDFYDLTYAYLKKAHEQHLLHVEMFFDPQTHLQRNVDFSIFLKGMYRAIVDAREDFGISGFLILCFLRDLSVDSAFETLEQALPYKKWIKAVGLDSAEKGNPPSKFTLVFKKALDEGFLTVAHAGEEGPADYIREALYFLKVSRIDHGNHCLDDKKLVSLLVKKKIPLTVCPLSNLKLKVVSDLKLHPLKKMIDAGLLVTLNSDDPAYFGGYLNENYLILQKALKLTKEEIYTLAGNSFTASFLSDLQKKKMYKILDTYYTSFV